MLSHFPTFSPECCLEPSATLSVMKAIVAKHPVDNFTAIKNYREIKHLTILTHSTFGFA